MYLKNLLLDLYIIPINTIYLYFLLLIEMLGVNWSIDVIIGTIDNTRKISCPFGSSAMRLTRDDFKRSMDQLVVEFTPMEQKEQKIREHSEVRINIKIQGINMISINIEDIVFVDTKKETCVQREDTRVCKVETTTKTLESILYIYRNIYTESISAIIFQCNFNDMEKIFSTLFSKDENK